MKKNFTRRKFVKGAAAAAGAAALAIAGCSGGGGNTDGTAAGGTEPGAAASSSEPSQQDAGSAHESHETQGGTPAVYFTGDITAESLTAVYQALGSEPQGNVAVKLSTGERGSNYLRPDLVSNLVKSLDATIVECNTAYGGERYETASHEQLAADHGFTGIAEVDIMDADGTEDLPVEVGAHLDRDIVGSHLANYDTLVSLAHFKGHAMAGFGGALKNISIGVAAREGKFLIHSAGATSNSWQSADQDDFLESMAEAASAVCDRFGNAIRFVNVMNRLSVDCDCDTSPAKPQMADIGILASMDPVALDQACVDLVYAAEDGQALVERIESRNGIHTLEHAEELGVGSRSYTLVRL